MRLQRRRFLRLFCAVFLLVVGGSTGAAAQAWTQTFVSLNRHVFLPDD